MRWQEKIEAELKALEAAGNMRQLREVELQGKYLVHEGREYLNLSSNDYLGLAASPLSELALESEGEVHWHGNPSSRLMTGNSPHYTAVEQELALLFPGKEALVCNCGFMANVGLPQAIAGKGDLILADKLAHASMIDGLRLTEAAWKRFRHNDLAHLEQLLQQAEAENVWVMVESVYSMDGDHAPLMELVALKKKYGFSLYVDEAHSFGVYGPKGSGLCAQLGILDEVDVLVCTFGKALAGAGAAVLCSPFLHRYLVNRMRSLIFTTALPPITLAWVAAMLRHARTNELAAQGMPSMADLRAHLAGMVSLFATLTGLPASSHIIPIPAGCNERALAMAHQGLQARYWVTATSPPTHPQG